MLSKQSSKKYWFAYKNRPPWWFIGWQARLSSPVPIAWQGFLCYLLAAVVFAYLIFMMTKNTSNLYFIFWLTAIIVFGAVFFVLIEKKTKR